MLAIENTELGDQISDSRMSSIRAEGEEHNSAMQLMKQESTGQQVSGSDQKKVTLRSFILKNKYFKIDECVWGVSSQNKGQYFVNNTGSFRYILFKDKVSHDIYSEFSNICKSVQKLGFHLSCRR